MIRWSGLGREVIGTARRRVFRRRLLVDRRQRLTLTMTFSDDISRVDRGINLLTRDFCVLAFCKQSIPAANDSRYVKFGNSAFRLFRE